MKKILSEYRKRCRKQPLGTREQAECMRKLAESIILQCIEDLWDKASVRQSAEFFSRRGFSICADIAGMDISDQVKLLELVNRAALYLKLGPFDRGRFLMQWFGHNMKSSLRQASLINT